MLFKEVPISWCHGWQGVMWRVYSGLLLIAARLSFLRRQESMDPGSLPGMTKKVNFLSVLICSICG